MAGIDWDVIGRFSIPPVVAILVDALTGDPPNQWHPVAWMGALIGRAQRLAPTHGRALPFLAGGLIVLLGAGTSASVGWLMTVACEPLSVTGWVLEGVALKATIAPRGLASAAREVRMALEAGDLPGARQSVAWHLVSRDTSTLAEHQVAAAAIESVAENTSDGVIAPLFWFAVGGLPAALAYRFANTADAMLGYRDAEREWLGKAAARCDDLLNLVPARLTALLILLCCGRFAAVRIWWRDCWLTSSPNAGHPMAAMAGALGVELEKVGAYTLGAGGHPPAPADIRRAERLLWAATVAGGALAVVAAGVRGALA